MPNENDPKETARIERKTPQTEKLLRQFLKLESGMYGSKTWRKNYDTALGATPPPLAKPAPCDSCEYVAKTIAEIDWHESRNAGHECCPDNDKPKDVPLCSKCGNPHTELHSLDCPASP